MCTQWRVQGRTTCYNIIYIVLSLHKSQCLMGDFEWTNSSLDPSLLSHQAMAEARGPGELELKNYYMTI